MVVVFQFHLVDPADVQSGARRPRGNPDWPEVGMFAQRARMRPNRLGVSTCRLTAVDGLALHVQGLDAIDGSPVLDVKPYMAEFEPPAAASAPTSVVDRVDARLLLTRTDGPGVPEPRARTGDDRLHARV